MRSFQSVLLNFTDIIVDTLACVLVTIRVLVKPAVIFYPTVDLFLGMELIKLRSDRKFKLFHKSPTK